MLPAATNGVTATHNSLVGHNVLQVFFYYAAIRRAYVTWDSRTIVANGKTSYTASYSVLYSMSSLANGSARAFKCSYLAVASYNSSESDA